VPPHAACAITHSSHTARAKPSTSPSRPHRVTLTSQVPGEEARADPRRDRLHVHLPAPRRQRLQGYEPLAQVTLVRRHGSRTVHALSTALVHSLLIVACAHLCGAGASTPRPGASVCRSTPSSRPISTLPRRPRCARAPTTSTTRTHAATPSQLARRSRPPSCTSTGAGLDRALKAHLSTQFTPTCTLTHTHRHCLPSQVRGRFRSVPQALRECDPRRARACQEAVARLLSCADPTGTLRSTRRRRAPDGATSSRAGDAG
jgi:hypothetical protein